MFIHILGWYRGEECMQLSKEFVEKLSQIFFAEEIHSDSRDNSLSDIFSKSEFQSFSQEKTD